MSCSQLLRAPQGCALIGLWFWLIMVPRTTAAQQPPIPAQAPTPAQATALQAEGLELQGVTLAHFSRPRPGRPIALQAIISNSSNQLAQAVALAKIDRMPELEAAANVVVPPKSVRSIELRLRVPEQMEAGQPLEISFSLNDPQNPQRVLLNRSGKPMLDSLRTLIVDDWFITGLAIDPDPPSLPEWDWPPPAMQMSYELTVAARVDVDLSRRTLTLDYENMPSQMVDWQGLDLVVIGNDGPFRDVAAMAALRRWLVAGGRAWVMLDLISPSDLNWLLSDGMACEMIDDVELNRFTIDTDGRAFSALDRTVEVEQPLRFRRVVQVGGEVTHSIDGFPAAIWYRIGRGEVLVTTLAAAGWVKPRQTERRSGADYQANYQMQQWAQKLADRIYERPVRETPIDVADVLYPVRHIGNPVLDRQFVLTILAGFCLVLCLMAAACWAMGKLMVLGWLVPLVSLVGAIPLLVASSQLRQDIPNTSAHVQLIEVQPGSETAQGTQWTATYMSGADQAVLRAESDSTVDWARKSETTDLRRWTWLDYGRWELSSSSWPAGLWRLQTKFAVPARPLEVPAKLTSEGLALQLPADFPYTLDDPVVQYWAGDPVRCQRLVPGRSTLVVAQHLTLADSWLGTTMVDDEQARRDEFYRQLQARDGQRSFPSYPAVMGWTERWPTPLSWSQPRDERGQALVVLPLKLEPVPAGQALQIPHTLLPARAIEFEGGISANFSNTSLWWRGETTVASRVAQRFHIPAQFQPFQASEILVDLQIRAPQRRVILSGLVDGQRIVLKELSSPLGFHQISITEPTVLALSQLGYVDLELDVQESPGKTATYQVDYLRINLNGQVAAR